MKRLLGREVRIPARTEPERAGLIAFPSEGDLPGAIRDGAVLEDALSWTLRAAGPGPDPAGSIEPGLPASATESPPLRNVVFVSHCDFTGSSALHVYAIACELYRRGLSPLVAVPDHADSVEDVGRPPFPVLTYAEAVTDALQFPDGRGPDLIHAFTPRELVREVTVELVRIHGCRYLVHLEDNDEVVLSGELGGADIPTLRALPLPVLDRIIQPRQSHPLRAKRLLEQAAGVTVLIERLTELVPAGVPSAVVRAGFDEAVLVPRRPRDEVRAEMKLEPGDLAIVYTGNVHSLNRGEMRELYAAVAELRRSGHRAVLVKTGWGSGVAATFPLLGDGIRDLGWVPRSSIPEILAAADVLVQPGGPGPFNDYRFPSKLPEYLAAGRPVVLPRTNVGLELRDGHEALLLERGDAAEIASAVARLAADPALRDRVGEGGRAFALRELRWSASVDRLEQLLESIQAEGRPAAPAWALVGADPPAKLVAVVPEIPNAAEAQAARAHGIYGFCLDARAVVDRAKPLSFGFPFCLFLGDVDPEAVRSAAAALASPGYIRTGGSPLVVRPDAAVVEKSPALGRDYEDAMRLHLSAPLPDHQWFRRVVAPRKASEVPVYSVWLRKLVLQTALRASREAPLIFVDVCSAWLETPLREAWLGATRTGMREGIRQFYASQHLAVSDAEAEVILRST